MSPHLNGLATAIYYQDLLREAEQERQALPFRKPRRWRHRAGDALIRLGHLLSEEPAPRPRPA